jgi:hypothetical protein
MVARGSLGGVAAGTLPVDEMAPVRRRTVVAAGAVLALNVALMLGPPAIAALALLRALR